MSEKATSVDFEAARKLVIDTLRPLKIVTGSEVIRLEQAHGRTLMAPLLADRDYPALRRSLRDGFAVRSSDVPGILDVRGEVRAGEAQQSPLVQGEALEIMTGAPVPEGADAVVMVEHVRRLPGKEGRLQVQMENPAEPGQFINAQGVEAQHNSTLILERTSLDASHVAALAMAGYTSVTVAAQPSVAVLATGDEIVEVSERPAPYQVRNSNSYMLASLVRAAGGIPTILPVARDTPESLRPLLERGLKYDLLLISGGVSAGRYDLVKPTLRDLGAEFVFERVRIQPGQPTAFAVCNGRPVFGLPGNPGSSLVTCQLFAVPALRMLAGEHQPIQPLLWAQFEAPFRHKGGLTRFLPARLSDDGQHLRHISWQGSSDVPALAKANALLVADHDRLSWEIGDFIRVMLKT